MAEIIFSLKHYWRFVDCEVLELKALSQGIDEKAACTQAELNDRSSRRSGSDNTDYRNLWRWSGIKCEEQLQGVLLLRGEGLDCQILRDRFPW